MMRFLIAAVALLAAPAAAAVPPQMKVELIASTTAPRPGSTIMVGFRMRPKPGWHGYWSNAGGSGIAPTVEWTAPPGFRFGPLLHPAPTLLTSMGVVSFVHSGEHVLISKMTVPADIEAGTAIPIRGDLSFAVCSDSLCVPGRGTFDVALTAGNGQASAQARMLSAAASRVPRPVAGGTFAIHNGKMILQLPGDLKLKSAGTRFFPDENGYFNALGARASGEPAQRIEAPLDGAASSRVSGVVSDGAAAYRLSFRPGPLAATAAKDPQSANTAQRSAENDLNPATSLESPASPLAEDAAPENWRGDSKVPLRIAMLLALALGGFSAFAWLRGRHT